VYRASLSCTGDDVTTGPGGATAADNRSGAGAVSRPRRSSRRDRRTFSARNRSNSRRSRASSQSTATSTAPTAGSSHGPLICAQRESAGRGAGGSRGAPMVLGCCLLDRHGSRYSGTPASPQMSTLPTSRRFANGPQPGPANTEALRSGRRACEPTRHMRLLLRRPRYAVHLTTDQKVRGSSPFGRATLSGIWPAETQARCFSRSVHCGPVVLLRCSSVSERLRPGCLAFVPSRGATFTAGVACQVQSLLRWRGEAGWTGSDVGRSLARSRPVWAAAGDAHEAG
jgi:hypothetical protein